MKMPRVSHHPQVFHIQISDNGDDNGEQCTVKIPFSREKLQRPEEGFQADNHHKGGGQTEVVVADAKEED